MKKYREFIFESVPVQVNPEINIDQIVYGNPPAEYQRLATREDDPKTDAKYNLYGHFTLIR